MKHHLRALWREYFCHPAAAAKSLLYRYHCGISSARHVFVLGAPRSGTTLVQRILSVHPVFYSIPNETGIFTWHNILHNRFGRNILTAEKAAALRRQARDLVELFDGFSEALEHPQGARFVEKTPQHVLHLDYILKHYPQSQIVHIHRDGRDCYCSARRHSFIPAAHSLAGYAKYWRRCIRSRFAQGTHRQIFDLPYEQLAATPAKTIKSLMHFLETEFDPRQLDPDHLAQDPRAELKDFQRLKQTITTSSVGRWQSELSANEVQRFIAIAGAELQGLGYFEGLNCCE